ncbi:MAG: hypothetical protein Q8L55_12305 [Phycisphaerales bacterium]|nr:hypothetical protein [Phycisphaerales bacterium]
MSIAKVQFVLAACAVVAAGAFLVAGPLNPPSGPVSAGGKTTQEIYDAVTNISGSIGTVGGRGPAVPGGDRSAGTFAISAGAQSFSGPILGLRLLMRRNAPLGGGGSTGAAVFDGCTIVREMGDGSARAYRIIATGQHAQTATAVVPSLSGNTSYAFSDVTIVGFRHYNIQRSDGSMAAMEELDLAFTSLGVTDASGFSYTHYLAQP